MRREAAVTAPGRAAVETWLLGTEHLELAAEWLARERNARWLDFGGADGRLSPLALKVMIRRPQHEIWVYGPPGERVPVGLVALGAIHPHHRTAEAWCVLGAKEYGPHDLTSRAVAWLLRRGFEELGLCCIYAWTAECNRGGRRILDRMGFRYAGRLRHGHRLDDRTYDRLWFDLLPGELANHIDPDAEDQHR